MLLEIFEVKINEHGHTLRNPLKMLQPLDDFTLFYHCSDNRFSIPHEDWYEVKNLLMAHGVSKFSYIDRTQ